MGLELDRIQTFERVKGTMQVVLKKTNPAMRLRAGRANPPVYIQGGIVYGEGGDVIENLPPWFWTELKKASPGALMECGWTRGVEQEPKVTAAPAAETSSITPPPVESPTVQTQPEPEVVKPERKWKCDYPGCTAEQMPLRKKGVHLAMHAKQEKRQERRQERLNHGNDFGV